MRIVVVEDSRTQAERLRLLLEANGYEVITATDGQRGIEACLKLPRPAAVISDVVMPQMDGYELARRLKQDTRTSSIPLMLLTTLDHPKVVFDAVEAGADNFMSKPYSDEKLLARLKRTIDGSRPTPTGVLINDEAGPIVVAASPARLAPVLYSALEDATFRASQLDRQRAQLEQANHHRQALMRVVAHELRTPLSTLSVRAKLDAIQQDQPSDPQSLASVVARNVSRMVRIIDDLVDANNIDLGTLTTELETVDLAEIVRSAVEEVRLMTSTHRIELPALEPLKLHADPRRLEQVIVNFLTNAIKYSPDADVARVDIESDEKNVRLAVVDQGIGLTESECRRVFERYFRAESGQQQAEGMGLGLHICKHIIELHGGQIGVDSTPGAGSTFWFKLPRA